MVGNVAFRSAVVGGFNREDVMNYVEKSVSENRAALEKARAETEEAYRQLTDLRAENHALREQMEQQQRAAEAQMEEIRSMADDYAALKKQGAQVTELEQALADLRAELDRTRKHSAQERGQLQRQNELKAAELNKEKERTELALAQANALSAEQAVQLETQNRELEQMRTQVKQMKRDSEAYQALCGRIGQIEMDMRFRTLRMEQEAREMVEAQAEEARAAYEDIVSNANGDAEEVRRLAREELEQMKFDVSSTSTGVNEAISNALSEMNLVKDMLEHLNGCLSEHVDAVNRIELNPAEEKELPEEAPEAAEESDHEIDSAEQAADEEAVEV